MKEHLSPKELAEALGVSESSVKRWSDEGRIPVRRTAGGHRRISIEDAVRYIRRTNAAVRRPDLLGFAESGDLMWQNLSDHELEDHLYDALVRGDGATAAGLVHGPFLAGRPLAWISDGPVRGAMSRIGELWRHQSDGILLEHRATDICIQAIMRIRLSLPAGLDAPTAVGGAVAGDPYLLPSLLAATVLRDVGMRDVNLGPQTPLDVFPAAAERENPRLVWISFSVVEAARTARAALPALVGELGETGASLIIGGRAVGELADLRHPNLTISQSMAELATFARGLLAQAPAGSAN